ncbi:MAG: hypothetical protein JXA78_20110 [Anaerolineales bacterium]|nr:hypothetical protein [Anaerolineales bacterium]
MAGLKTVIFLARFSGLSLVYDILNYTLLRERWDRRYRKSKAAQESTGQRTPGRLQSVEETPGGARFDFENASLEAIFLAPDLVRISWQPGIPPLPYTLAKTDWPLAEARLGEFSEGYRLAGPQAQILVTQYGELQFLDANGVMLRHEAPPEQSGPPEAPWWTSLAYLRPEECLYGLGEQANRLNLRGGSHRLWNTDPGGSYSLGADPLYIPIPLMLSLHRDGSHLIFYENPFPATFNFDAQIEKLAENPQLARACFEGGMLRYYLIPGPPQRALERYTELTGRPGLPPLWSLGYHQSRWGYKTEADIRAVVAGFEAHDLPLSAVHLDIDYMDGYRVFTVDQGRFPDLAALAEELGQKGIRLVTILDPGVKEDIDYFLFREGLLEGAFCTLPNKDVLISVVWPGRAAFPDFSAQKTRQWWSRQYPRLSEMGVAGFWHDMNEPASFVAWGRPTLPLSGQHDLEGRGGDHREAHNLYGLLMNRSGYEALRAQRPERRPWILSRSGWASNQRYAWNWSGDTESSWGSLRLTIANALGMGLSGLPYTGPDIGGFSGDPPAELYLRWFQLATFLPFFRTHSAIGTARREPWVYGEPYTDILREYLRLRYRLLPYLYTLAWQASQNGQPLARPLFWADVNNQELWEIDDAFLLGDALLVAPILEEGENRRRVTLPEGGWYDLWDDSIYQGPGSVELQAPLERIPVLVRAGSILPMVSGERLFLHAYAPDIRRDLPIQQATPPSLLFSDAGDGYGEQRLESFTFNRRDVGLEIAWRSEGGYPFPYSQVTLILHGIEANAAWIDGKETPISGDHLITGMFRTILFEV